MNIKRLIGCEDMTWFEILFCLTFAVGAFLFVLYMFIEAMPDPSHWIGG